MIDLFYFPITPLNFDSIRPDVSLSIAYKDRLLQRMIRECNLTVGLKNIHEGECCIFFMKSV